MSYLNDRQTSRLWAKIKAYVTNAIGGITSVSFVIVQTLPATGAAGAIYLVPNSGSSPNIYDEYIYVANAWEKIGTTEIDLSGYVQTSRKINNKALSSDITLSAEDVGAAASSHEHAASDITSGTLSAAHGGTGKNSVSAAANAFMVSLNTQNATSDVTDDTLIATSANTGETNTWYRRPAPKLWNYIKRKTDALYASKSTIPTSTSQLTNDSGFLTSQDISGKLDKSGGTMTGALTLSGAPTSDLHAATKKYVDDNAGREENIFVAEYGVATASDVENAWEGGKAVYIKYNVSTSFSRTYLVTAIGTNDTSMSIYCVISDGRRIFYINKSTGSWMAGDSYDFAKLSSPAFTGTPTAPTAASGTDTTQIATTAFVQDAVESSVPTNVSDLTNDSGYIAGDNMPDIFSFEIIHPLPPATEYTMDKTFAEILAAYQAGKLVIGRMNGHTLTTAFITPLAHRFYSLGGQNIGRYDISDDNTVTAAVESYQLALTFDSTPTSGSSNPVTSGGLYTVIGNIESLLSNI